MAALIRSPTLGHKSSHQTITPGCSSHDQPLDFGRHRDGDFWDSLSRIHLTARALRELDRRNDLLQEHAATSREIDQDVSSILGLVDTSLIQRFARAGGPDLVDLRGLRTMPRRPRATAMQAVPPSREPPPQGSDTISSPRSTPYSANFRQKLIDTNVFPHKAGQRAENWDEVHRRLAQRRPSLTSSQFSDGQFEKFEETYDVAANEADVMCDLISFISGDRRDRRAHPPGRNIPFNNLHPLDPSLSAPQPDLYEGMPPIDIPLRVRTDLGHYITPSKDTSRPAAPNFFSEWKGLHGRTDAARLQACHDGAVGARAIHALQNYREDEPRYDNKVSSFSTTFHDGTLKIYGTHITAPAAGEARPSYYLAPLSSFAMTNSPQVFRAGAAAYRNAQDYAAEVRGASIREAARRVARSD